MSDTLVVESYEFRKNIRETRQELSHALSQCDAATRVLGKLLKKGIMLEGYCYVEFEIAEGQGNKI